MHLTLLTKKKWMRLLIVVYRTEYAFAVILAAAFGLDIVDHDDDKDLFNQLF